MAASRNLYMFGDDIYALARLNYQHSLWKQGIGFLVHPEIPVGDIHDLRIADIGSGTCIWLTELSDCLPSTAQLDAYDISDSHYPPQQWLPDNISLHVHNAFLPFPEDAIGKYDIIHVQAFISIMANNDPSTLVQNLISLLKPGGYLQWTEIDSASGKMVMPEGASVSTEATNQFIKFLQKPQAGHSIGWVSQLDRSFEKHGLSDVSLSRYAIAPKNYFQWNLNRLWTAHEIGKKVCVEGLAEEDVNSLVAETFEEFQQGVAITADLVVAVGKKNSCNK